MLHQIDRMLDGVDRDEHLLAGVGVLADGLGNNAIANLIAPDAMPVAGVRLLNRRQVRPCRDRRELNDDLRDVASANLGLLGHRDEHLAEQRFDRSVGAVRAHSG